MPASSDKIAGTVVSVTGEARAIAADGTSRILHAGDRVFMKEAVATTANAVVQIHLESGRLFDLTPDSTLVLDESVSGSGVPAGPPRTAPEESPESLVAVVSGAESNYARLSTESTPSEETREGDHPTVVVEQANTSAAVPSPSLIVSNHGETATADAGKNPLREEASFLVQEGPLFRPPAVVAGIHEDTVANPGDGRVDLTDAANDPPVRDLLAHGSADSIDSIGGDKLALSDLLQGEPGTNDLAAFLSFSYDAHTNSTTVNVHPAGGGEDQKIVLMGIDLTAGGTQSTDSIIQALLSHGKLHPDA